MAVADVGSLYKQLNLPLEIAEDAATGLNLLAAETEVRDWVTTGEYDRITSNKKKGDTEYDRLVYAETILCFVEYIGNRGGVRLSQKGGLVRDLGLVNQQQTIRQLLSQGEVEEVQGRMREQAKQILGDLVDSNQQLWGV
jgi:hypothetical protein